jgi:hypothetical protein
MRKVSIIVLGIALFGSAGCLKDTPATDLTHVGTVIEMIYPPGAGYFGVGSGIQYFGGCVLSYPLTDASDTAVYYVNIAGTNTLPAALDVTVGLESKDLLDNYSTDSVTYYPMPDSLYSILTNSGTIPAGQRMDTFQLVFYPDKIDMTQSYGLPIGITAAGTYTISGNFGMTYFHTTGIAGIYTDSNAVAMSYSGTVPYTFNPNNPYVYPGDSTVISLSNAYPKLAANPTNPYQVTLPYANNLGNYVINFTSSDVLTVTPDATLAAAVTNFTVYYAAFYMNGGGNLILHLVTGYTNSSGGSVIVDETLTHNPG